MYITLTEKQWIEILLNKNLTKTIDISIFQTLYSFEGYKGKSPHRKKCIEKYGYDCFICRFNFQKNYGEVGKEEYEVNPIQDLRPVCPNCHTMLHRKIPAYSIEEIQNIIKGQTL
jgi:predicted HNH restriction endonuclease